MLLLQEWANANNPDEELFYYNGYWSQIMFVRDSLTYLVGADISDYKDREKIARVISAHTSKSVTLPVYSLERKDLGLQLVLRYNFYDWKLSVISQQPIEADFSGLFYTTSPVEPEYTGNPLASCYFEGFPKDLIFGYYQESDHKKWSAEIGTGYGVWTTIFLMMRSLGVIKPHKWQTSRKSSS